MIRQRFSAQELYILAQTAGRTSMYGIPDGFAWLPEEDLPAARNEVIDSLLSEGIVEMDFDGHLSVSPDYLGLVDVYCSCRKCLTINRQCAEGTSEDWIFWENGGSIYLAEIDEENFLIRKTNALEVEEVLCSDAWICQRTPSSQKVILPQIALTKAKRFALEGDADGALRILRQNDCDDRTAAVLLDGLSEKARYLRLVLMDMGSGDCEKVEKAWLNSRCILFALGSTVINFRTCTVFEESEKEHVSLEIRETLAAFLQDS